MKGYFFSMLIAFLLMEPVYSQFEEKTGSIGLLAGVAIPVSDFGSSDFSNDKAGTAIPGFSGSFIVNLPINDWWGFAGTIIHNNNPLDEEAYLLDFKTKDPSLDYTFDAQNYQMTSLLGGAFASIPQGDVMVQLKGFIGYSIAVLPEITSSASNGIQLITRRNNTSVFTLGGGLCLTYPFTETLSVKLDATYVNAKPEFKAVVVESYVNNTLVQISGADIPQQFDVLSISLGIGIDF